MAREIKRLDQARGEHFGADLARNEQNKAGIVWEKSGNDDQIWVSKRRASRSGEAAGRPR